MANKPTPSDAPRSRPAKVRTRRIRSETPVKPSKASGASPREVMDRVYVALSMHILDVMGKKPLRSATRRLGRELLYGVTEVVFRTAIKEGFFRFPDGWGTLHIRPLKGTRRRLPTGTIVELSPSRHRLRYDDGAAVRALLGMPQRTKFERRFLRRSKLTDRALKAAQLSD